MTGGKSKASSPKSKASINRTLLLAVLSLVLCWFYGVPGLVIGFFSLRGIKKFAGSKKQLKPATLKKLQWAKQIGWAGTGFSAVFTIIYLLALVSGAFISL
jgi:hypothetical protein